jgi:leader peptidase (prepilin peptidase)/N-methyltransferase
MRDPAVDIFISLWLTMFGCCIGSFLNVIVYRLPLGKSLSFPPSHCPKCGHTIRWFDNVPVFGWLWLGGKCRDCKEPISFQYPFIEGFCGAVFGSIAVWLLYNAATMPVWEVIGLTILLAGIIVSVLTVVVIGIGKFYRRH